MSTAREKVIFLHLHKTGGLSANVILDRQYIGQRGATIHNDVPARVRELIALPQAERDRLAYLSGHFHYGIHDIWSSPASYFTFLREPISRTLSNYNFLGIIPRGVANPSLRGEFDSYMRAPRNTEYYIRRIAGYRPGLPGEVYTDVEIGASERLSIAEAHLRQMKVVGLTEEFDVSLLLLRRAYGWRNIYYVRRNITAEKGATVTLSPEMRQEISLLYAYDTALYETAKAIFAEQCRAYGDTLETDLLHFRRNNATYSRVAKATAHLRDTKLYAFIRRMTSGILRG